MLFYQEGINDDNNKKANGTADGLIGEGTGDINEIIKNLGANQTPQNGNGNQNPNKFGNQLSNRVLANNLMIDDIVDDIEDQNNGIINPQNQTKGY